MSLRVVTLRDEEEERMKLEGKFYIADRRLYLTADRQFVVEEGDPDAAFLYAAIGHRIPIEFAEQHGLVKKPKAKRKSSNKALPKSKNKSKK